MKSVLLLLTILGVALVCAELQTEDQYTEYANVVAVDDSAPADEMEDFEDDEMPDSRRAGCSAGSTYYKATFDEAEPLADTALGGNYVGKFEMKICNDGSFAKYKSDFRGAWGSATKLNYRPFCNTQLWCRYSVIAYLTL